MPSTRAASKCRSAPRAPTSARRLSWPWRTERAGLAESDGDSARQRMGERTAIDVFELTTDRHAMRDAARPDVSLRRAFSEEMRSRLAFHGRIRGENHLVHFTGIEQRFEFTGADLFR